MPIYEYRCEGCGHELEKLQRMSDAPLRDCPECGTPQLRRLISAAGFRLKGGGWYETDFKQDNRRNLADGGKDDSKAKESGKDAKKDSGEAGKKAAPESKSSAGKAADKSGGQASAA